MITPANAAIVGLVLVGCALVGFMHACLRELRRTIRHQQARIDFLKEELRRAAADRLLEGKGS